MNQSQLVDQITKRVVKGLKSQKQLNWRWRDTPANVSRGGGPICTVSPMGDMIVGYVYESDGEFSGSYAESGRMEKPVAGGGRTLRATQQVVERKMKQIIAKHYT